MDNNKSISWINCLILRLKNIKETCLGRKNYTKIKWIIFIKIKKCSFEEKKNMQNFYKKLFKIWNG